MKLQNIFVFANFFSVFNCSESTNPPPAYFIACASIGDVKCVAGLLKLYGDAGLDIINYPDPYFGTALMTAVTNNHFDMVVFLVEHGANMTIKNRSGVTATKWPIFQRRTDLRQSRMPMIRSKIIFLSDFQMVKLDPILTQHLLVYLNGQNLVMRTGFTHL